VKYHDEVTSHGKWDLEDFGTDRDLYDVNGVQIYEYVNGTLYHRDYDEVNGTWLNSSHIEDENTTHSEEIR
jgi:hypothetical protein